MIQASAANRFAGTALEKRGSIPQHNWT